MAEYIAEERACCVAFPLGLKASITDSPKMFIFHVMQNIHPDVHAACNALVEFIMATSRPLKHKLNLTLKQC